MTQKEEILEIDGVWDEHKTVFTGKCEITYPNGDQYKGEVEQNTREGFGTY